MQYEKKANLATVLNHWEDSRMGSGETTEYKYSIQEHPVWILLF